MPLRQRLTSPFLNSLAVLASVVPLWRPDASTSSASAPSLLATAPAKRDRRLRRSLSLSVTEGLFAEVVTACAGGYVFTAWALHLGFSAVAVAGLASLPFLAQVAQLPGAWLTSWLGHRRAALWTVTASRQVLWPLVVLPFLPVSNETRRTVLLAVAGLAAVLGVLGNNAWVAWMGELVPLRLRGRYFGRRTGILTVATTAASVGAGLCIDWARPHGFTAPALACLALLACLAGSVTTVLLARQHDPAPTTSEEGFCWRDLKVPFADPRARAVLQFQVVWNVAIGVSATLFTLYILTTLHLGFGWLAVYNGGIAAVRFGLAPVWGRVIDRFGVRPVLAFCSFGLVATPLWWLVSPGTHLVAFLAVDVVASGLLWSGHGLATFALPLAMAPRRGRPFYLAAFASVGGLAYALAAFVGGALGQVLPAHFSVFGMGFVGFQVVFVVSSGVRLLGGFIARQLQETSSRTMEDLVAHVRSETRTRITRTMRAPLSVGARVARAGFSTHRLPRLTSREQQRRAARRE